jgi:very-short-patch-repair endonuclease
MGAKKVQPWAAGVWTLARRQHGVVARRQLLGLEMSSKAIEHRVAIGRLHPLMRGVYALGRPTVDERGRWMAAILACGPDALLSHCSAANLWDIHSPRPAVIEVTVPSTRRGHRPGIRVNRRALPPAPADAPPCWSRIRRSVAGIPLTDPVTTLIDLAASLPIDEVEDAVNAADRIGLVRIDRLRAALASRPPRPGTGRLKKLLDPRTFRRTDTRLERRFLPIAAAAGLPLPQTQVHLNGYRVDFYWPELRLVVETDGLTYHRTPSQQAEDIRRDQAHMAAGLAPLRFTRDQVYFEPAYVRGMLETARRQRTRSSDL